MEVAAAFTVWLTFGAWLFLATVPAPRLFSRVALALCGAELLACAVWTFPCAARLCAAFREAARIAASIDIPALTAWSILLATIYALRRARAR